MKKLILISCCLMFVLSCEMEQSKSVEPVLKTDALRKELIKKSSEELLYAFTEMSFEDQRQLWHDKLILDSRNYFGERREFLVRMAISQMSEGYDPQADKKKAIELFGVNEAMRITASLYLSSEERMSNPNLVRSKEGPGEGCNCNFANDFCDFQNNSGIPGEVWDCNLGQCIQSALGCGILFLQECNGRCVGGIQHQ